MDNVDIEVEAGFEDATEAEVVVESVVEVVVEAVVELVVGAVVVGAEPKEQHNCCREPVLDFQNKSQKNKDTPVLLKRVSAANLGWTPMKELVAH